MSAVEAERLQGLSVGELIEYLSQAVREVDSRRMDRTYRPEQIRIAGQILEQWPVLFAKCNQNNLLKALDAAARAIYPRGKPWDIATLESLLDREARHLREVGQDYPMNVLQLDRAHAFVEKAWRCLNEMHRQGRLKIVA